MYRSSQITDEMEYHSQNGNGHIQNGDLDNHYSFFNRVLGLPLVREATNLLQNKYESTKERSGLLKSVLEKGESTVALSWGIGSGILQKTGITNALEKPLHFVDSKAVQMLDSVEKKIPMIAQSPYEIKLTVRDKIDGTCDQIASARENLRTAGVQALESLKSKAESEVQHLLETPVAQTVSHKFEGILNNADQFVDRVLPEGYSHQNGKSSVANGTATVTTVNGYHNGNLQHAKCLTAKLARRVSMRVTVKSHGVMEVVKRNTFLSTTRSVVVLVENRTKSATQQVKTTVARVYAGLIGLFAKGVDSSLVFLYNILPAPLQQRFNQTMEVLTEKIVHKQGNGNGIHLHHE